MPSPRALLLLLLGLFASTQALMLQTASHLGLQRAASSSAHWSQGCVCMGCRTNLKKEKRARNRINAFRFKKGGFVRRRFNGPDYAKEQKNADEDNQHYALVFSYTAEEAAAAEAEAKKAPKEAAA